MKGNGVFNSILERMIGERIHVELKDDGVSVEGFLVDFDEKMNLVLEAADETHNGRQRIRYGRILIRGSSIVSVRPAANPLFPEKRDYLLNPAAGKPILEDLIEILAP